MVQARTELVEENVIVAKGIELVVGSYMYKSCIDDFYMMVERVKETRRKC